MDGKNRDSVMYQVDIIAALAERTIKRLTILVFLLVLLLFGTNAAWIYYNSQFERVEQTEVTQTNDNGLNNYIGESGDIINGNADDKGN